MKLILEFCIHITLWKFGVTFTCKWMEETCIITEIKLRQLMRHTKPRMVSAPQVITSVSNWDPLRRPLCILTIWFAFKTHTTQHQISSHNAYRWCKLRKVLQKGTDWCSLIYSQTGNYCSRYQVRTTVRDRLQSQMKRIAFVLTLFNVRQIFLVILACI